MFEMPKLLPYPTIRGIADCPEVVDVYCYLIAEYKPGYSLLIKLADGEVGLVIGDWSGGRTQYDPTKHNNILSDVLPRLAQLMGVVGLQQAQYFFDEAGNLVDVQVSVNKFLGPGMLRDLFTKMLPTQQIMGVQTLSKENVGGLRRAGSKLIVKPSRFRAVLAGGVPAPLYARI